MNDILNEDQELEQLKKWWHDNGTSVIAGLVIGLAGVGGWQYWQGHQQSQAAQASAYFQSLQQSANLQQPDPALEQAKRLRTEFDGSSYAVFAGLTEAKLQHEKGESAAAIDTLKGLLQSELDASLADLVRLRLARLLFADGQLDQADAVLAEVSEDGAFAGRRADLAGDLALARGDDQAAKSAYRRALESDSVDQALLRMKLAELGDVGV